uniref:Uncharacterized protein n=1 Tax=Ananas comosus var. bracteatus TaxID=296719 RepID=A0A6V7PI94_ANACO|nr:unnamed protein product [Ananas comosus var. bracteatus]
MFPSYVIDNTHAGKERCREKGECGALHCFFTSGKRMRRRRRARQRGDAEGPRSERRGRRARQRGEVEEGRLSPLSASTTSLSPFRSLPLALNFLRSTERTLQPKKKKKMSAPLQPKEEEEEKISATLKEEKAKMSAPLQPKEEEEEEERKRRQRADRP